jgi:hypothetical protein
VRRALVLVAAVVVVVVTACSGGGSGTRDQPAFIYSAVIRAVIADTSQPRISSDTSVFVVAADERSPIPLEVQADIVGEVHALATIRFVDHRVEALDDSSATRAVNDDGILITLGTISRTANTAMVDAGRYVDTADTVAYRVTLERTNAHWKPIATSSRP